MPSRSRQYCHRRQTLLYIPICVCVCVCVCDRQTLLYIPICVCVYVCVCVCMLVAQLYLALCDPMGCCLPGSTVHGILQARSWSGQTFPSPGDLPDLGIEPGSPQVSCIAADSVPCEPPGDSIPLYVCTISSLAIPLLSYC